MDIGNSILVHREFERGKSMADNGGPVRVILNRHRRSLGFTSIFNGCVEKKVSRIGKWSTKEGRKRKVGATMLGLQSIQSRRRGRNRRRVKKKKKKKVLSYKRRRKEISRLERVECN